MRSLAEGLFFSEQRRSYNAFWILYKQYNKPYDKTQRNNGKPEKKIVEHIDGAGIKRAAPISIYSNIASTSHISDAPQYIQQRMPTFISFSGAFLYQTIVEAIAANTVVSSVIFAFLRASPRAI